MWAFVLSFKWLWQLFALSDVREEMRKWRI